MGEGTSLSLIQGIQCTGLSGQDLAGEAVRTVASISGFLRMFALVN